LQVSAAWRRPVRLLHRLNFVPVRRQVFEPVVWPGCLVVPHVQSPKPIQARKVESSKLGNQNRKGSVLLFKVNERLTGDNFRDKLYKITRW
jgi:hypothetical protein